MAPGGSQETRLAAPVSADLVEGEVELRVLLRARQDEVPAGVVHGEVVDEDAAFVEVLGAVHAVGGREGGEGRGGEGRGGEGRGGEGRGGEGGEVR